MDAGDGATLAAPKQSREEGGKRRLTGGPGEGFFFSGL